MQSSQPQASDESGGNADPVFQGRLPVCANEHAKLSASQSDVAALDADQLREQLLQCAAEYKALQEENSLLSEQNQRLSKISQCAVLPTKPKEQWKLFNNRPILNGTNHAGKGISLAIEQVSPSSNSASDERLENRTQPCLPCFLEPAGGEQQSQLSSKSDKTHQSEQIVPPHISVGFDGEERMVISLDDEEEADAEPSCVLEALSVLVDSYAYRAIVGICLCVALFGNGVVVLSDFPDQPANYVLDVVMSIILVVFMMEVVLNCIVDCRDYPLSFFFWMDIVGTASMAFELSYLLSPNGKIKESSSDVDLLFLRTARMARVGARVGRLFKLLKFLSLLFRGQSGQVGEFDPNSFEAKAVSQRLGRRTVMKLMSRISCIVITMVLVMPFLQVSLYPETDNSMRLWGRTLEQGYAQAYEELSRDVGRHSTDVFRASVMELVNFYEDVNYMPYRIEGYSEEVDLPWKKARILSSSLLPQPSPKRLQNVLKQVVEVCHLQRPACEGVARPAIFFDFSSPTKMEVVMDMILILVIIAVICVAACDMNRVVEPLLVKPLERMLSLLQTYASDILDQALQVEGKWQYLAGRFIVSDTEVLEDIFGKVARLAHLSTQETLHQDLEDIDPEGQGVLLDIMNVKVSRRSRPSLQSDELKVSGAGVEHVDTWGNLNVLLCSKKELLKVTQHIFFESELAINTQRALLKQDTFKQFYEMAVRMYQDVPYHCFAHAVDVLYTVQQVLATTQSGKWLSHIDQYALMVAALCHDVGHVGRTTAFLVETRHPLALLYNDNSPLENMHCAKLFAMCDQPETDVFASISVEEKRQARKVCISTILHTDPSLHVGMVKEVSRIYEVSSDVCDLQAGIADLSQRYTQEILQKDTMLWLELLLHFADISNPLKTFDMCQAWAWRVLEEFFSQGDEEKELGLPVGMLNDRTKVSRPGSQHGFIIFMVAPLVTATVHVFPALHPLALQMAANLEHWRDIWVEDAQPSMEELAKRNGDVEKLRAEAEELRLRTSGGPALWSAGRASTRSTTRSTMRTTARSTRRATVAT